MALAVSLVVLIIIFGIHSHLSGARAVSKAKLPALRAKMGANLAPLQETDKRLTERSFLTFAKHTFISVHRALTLQEPQLAAGVLEGTLYEQYASLIDHQRKSDRKTVEKRLKVHGMAIRSAVVVGRAHIITVRVLFTCADYEVDNRGNKLGDRRIRAWQEDWTFQRTFDPGFTPWSITGIQLIDSKRDRFTRRKQESALEWTLPVSSQR